MASTSPEDRRPCVLVLTSTYPRWLGDPEPGFVHELGKRLAQPFRVIVLGPHALGALPHETLEGVEVIRYRYAPARLETLVNDGGIVTNLRNRKWKVLLVPSFVFMQAWNAWRLIRSREVDVIHAHWLIPQGLIAALLRMLPGRKVPFVVTSHGADLYALKGSVPDALKRFVAGQAGAVTVVSGAMLEKLKSIRADMPKTRVMPMGVDLAERFTPNEAVLRSEREILFVGRLVEKKGVRYLLDAMPAVLRSFPDAHLTIAGFGPEAQALQAQATNLGLARAVSFLGAVPQAGLPALYRRASLLVAPFVQARMGDQEGLGLVLLEAVGCGCPILAGDVPALAEVLGNDFDDMAVTATDVESLSDCIIEALASPHRIRDRAAQLRQVLAIRFDWSNVASHYLDLFRKVRDADTGTE